MNRTDVEFNAEGTTLRGWLYRPEGDAPVPGVAMAHGFSAVKEMYLDAFAEVFAEAGLACLVFDNRNFGASDGEPRQVVSIAGQLEDVRDANAYVRGRADVDPDRVALWGTSLGGGHALTLGARDHRLAAVVAQVPFNGFPRRVQGRSIRQAVALLWAAVRDQLRGWTNRPPVYVKTVGAPDELAVMTGDDANRTVATIRSGTWENRVAPRGILQMMRYRPGRTVADIRAPLLVCLAEHDRETTGATTEQLARTAPRGELRSYPFGHFDIYRPEARDRVLADQIAFLARALTSEPSRPGHGTGDHRRSP